MRIVVVLAALTALSGSALAQDTMKDMVVKPDALKWREVPIFPPGNQVAIVVGDPAKAGLVVVRVKNPPHYRVPPHTHPYTEVITVISGRVGVGMGEKFDVSIGEMVQPGTVIVVPQGHTHFSWTEDEGAMVQVYFTGPGGITYINPADDPRTKKQ